MRGSMWNRILAVTVAGLIGAVSSGNAQARTYPLLGASGEKIYGSGTVEDARFLSNGEILTVGGLGVQVWDGSTGEFKRWIGNAEELPAKLTELALSADERKALVGGGDSSATMLDVGTGQVLATFRHTDQITTVALSPDGTRVLTGTQQNGLRCWNAENGEILEDLPISGFVRYCEFLDNTKVVFNSTSRGTTAKTWDFEKQAELPLPPDLISGAEGYLVSPDRQRLLVAKANELVVWNRATEQYEKRYENSWSKYDLLAAFAPGREEFVLAGRSSKEKPLQLARYHNGEVKMADLLDSPRHIHYSKDGKSILFVQHGLEIWDAETLSRQTRWGDFDFTAYADLSPDETTVVTGFYEPRIVDLEKGTVTEPAMFISDRIHTLFLFAPDGESLVGYGTDLPFSTFVEKRDADTLEVEWLKADMNHSFWDMVFTSSGSKLLVFSNKRAAFVDMENGDLLVESPFDLGEVGYVGYSPDAQEIYIFSTDIFDERSVYVYDRNLNEEKYIFFVENDAPHEFLVTPDGTAFVTLDTRWWPSEEGITTFFKHFIVVRDLLDGTTLLEFPVLEHSITAPESSAKDWVHCWVFRNNGEELLVGYESGAIRAFSMKTGQLLRTLTGHRDIVFNLKMFKDGKRLMSNSMDGTIRIWNLDAAEVSDWDCH